MCFLSPKCVVPVSLFALLTNCSKVCDHDSQPHYTLTTGQRAWAAPYPKNAVLRFRNSSGYERTYRVVEATNESGSGGGSKSSVCSAYQSEYFFTRLERTDSAGVYRGLYFQKMDAAVDQIPFKAQIQWASSDFSLPIAEIEDGKKALGPATFAGRTYQNVLDLPNVDALAPNKAAWGITRIFITKADGVIRFEERGGTAWNRL